MTCAVDDPFFFENLRVDGFKLHMNILKNEVWADCHCIVET